MSIKYGISFVTILFMLFSCSQKNQFPVKLSEKVAFESVVINGPLIRGNGVAKVDSVQKNDFEKELNGLLIFKKYYDEQNEAFDLTKLQNLWSSLKNESQEFSFEDKKRWIEITGFLFEITGNELYAEALEDVVYQNNSSFSEAESREIENSIVPFIFTKNVDHIHVNLFVNATIKYEHTLKGAVEITQETSYPASGKVQIKFKMENKRLIELFIRIPEWAEGATVVEKGVKYVATPGSYCLIARKWNEGDFVEINFPIEKKKLPHSTQ